MDLRVASFNIRNGRALDGLNSWPLRRRTTAGVVRRLAADVVGLQEAYLNQERFLLRQLPRYGAVSAGRRDGRRGERCPILFDAARFELVAHETFWYSEDPGRPGSSLPGASFPRIATTAAFLDRVSGCTIGVANTHLDEHSPDNRLVSVELLARSLPRRFPWVVVGDFNAQPDDALFDVLTARGFRHALPPDAGGTTHGFTGRRDGLRLDHVLVTPDWQVVHAEVSYGATFRRLPSDHWPVVVDLRLP